MKAGGKRPNTKNTRGLKYLSNKVCEALSGVGTAIPQEKMISLLYQSFISENNSDQEMCGKSIRRQIYDTINVLIALGLVVRTRQHIEWTGELTEELRSKLTDKERQVEEMKHQISMIRMRTRDKRKLLEDEELHYVRTKTLLDRNEGIRRHKRSKRRRGEKEEPEPIHLPFLVVRTSKLANVECVQTPDLQRCSLNVSKDVDIYNDYDIICLMAGGAASSHSVVYSPTAESKTIEKIVELEVNDENDTQQSIQCIDQRSARDLEMGFSKHKQEDLPHHVPHFGNTIIQCIDQRSAQDLEMGFSKHKQEDLPHHVPHFGNTDLKRPMGMPAIPNID